EAGRKAAHLAALNVLAVARQYLGSLDKVTRIVRLGASVATSGDIRDQPKVADAASELLQDVFGKDKNPCRLVYGVASLPLGAPVGFRMALAHPERIEALIVQDAVAHNVGLGANWQPRRAFWADRAANESTLRTNLLSLPTTRTRHVGNDPNVERYDPDLWTDECAFLNQPGQADIQSDLFYDYRTNVDAYPQWQARMREKQPRLLVIWGKYDLSFDLSEPQAYRRHLPNPQVHMLDAGHLALDTAPRENAALA